MNEIHTLDGNLKSTHFQGAYAKNLHNRYANNQEWDLFSFTWGLLSSTIPRPRAMAHSTVKVMFQLRNQLVNTLYPLPPWVAAAICLGAVGVVQRNPSNVRFHEGWMGQILQSIDHMMSPFHHWVSQETRIGCLVGALSALCLLFLVYINHHLLRILLAYRGWMTDSPSQPSLLTKAWGLALYILFLGNPRALTFSLQSTLPNLPIPSIEQTVSRYLDSMQSCLSPEEYEVTRKNAQVFTTSRRVKCMQFLLWLKSWLTNYVSDWWLQYAYLMGRSPLLINSNYYGLGYAFPESMPSHNQAARAGVLTYNWLLYKKMLDHEELAPTMVRGIVPVCMAQYKHMFSTTRIPMKDRDKLQQYPSALSKHIIVTHRGLFYYLKVVHGDTNELLTPAELCKQYQCIMDHGSALVTSENAPSQEELCLASLTTQDRNIWAEVRQKEFSGGLNRASLETVESAIMIVALDTHQPKDWSETGHLSLHSDGAGLWCDKSFTLLVYGNGKAAIHGEHSWGDAPALAHAHEHVFAAELTGNHYDEEGNIKEKAKGELPLPSLLQWTMTATLTQAIQAALERVHKDIDDLDLKVSLFNIFGKNVIKKLKISPDAFIQMAMQLAYYREYKRCPNTYESSATRLYLEGRTETIRSCSIPSREFVLGMEDPALDRPARMTLLQRAASHHTWLSQQAMCGNGVDRHLFALYVASRALGFESAFLNGYLAVPWHLSTSQLPQRQAPEMWPKDVLNSPKHSCPSGGFGPVYKEGYGVSYMVAGDEYIYFHVSSRRACGHTNSQRFTDRIFQALRDMRALASDMPLAEAH